MDQLLSVIIPSFNEEGMIPKTSKTISGLLEEAEISYELIFVNDGSTDTTWEKIRQEASGNSCVKGVNFSRNFGKESAIYAGLFYAAGDCCVVIDCDLQHPPEKIIEMYHLWEEGYEIVEGVKHSRGEKESPAHFFAARCFYKIISRLTDIDMTRASDFKLLDRKAVNALLNIREKNAFFRALSSWIGFKTTSVEFDVREREIGETKWSTWSLIKYAVSNISSFSAAPMQIVSLLGSVMLLISLILGGIALYQKIIGTALEGFTTVIIINLFTGSIIMLSLGIIGYYISKIYDEIQGRPKYIVRGICGDLKNTPKEPKDVL
ncbi:MAG TPA: glycosyltransferase family 2 protein [Candidatus Anaerobutyricum faecale]|nr:glycosyltransferase family 2 protein [Candidatus Anaerobutyricum faecale]